MKKIILLLGVVLVIGMISCSSTGIGLATGNPIGSKVGVAEKKIILGIAFNVDLGAATAAKNGGIKKIATVDSYVSGNIFVKKYKVVVTGE